MYVCMTVYVHVPEELELEAIVSYLMWVLGIELQSSGSAVNSQCY